MEFYWNPHKKKMSQDLELACAGQSPGSPHRVYWPTRACLGQQGPLNCKMTFWIVPRLLLSVGCHPKSYSNRNEINSIIPSIQYQTQIIPRPSIFFTWDLLYQALILGTSCFWQGNNISDNRNRDNPDLDLIILDPNFARSREHFMSRFSMVVRDIQDPTLKIN